MKIRTDNGKYTFVVQDGAVTIVRGGELWLAVPAGFNAIHSLLCELDAARVVVEAARMMGDEAPAAIRLALRVHDGLVDDREPPSPWAPLSEAAP